MLPGLFELWTCKLKLGDPSLGQFPIRLLSNTRFRLALCPKNTQHSLNQYIYDPVPIPSFIEPKSMHLLLVSPANILHSKTVKESCMNIWSIPLTIRLNKHVLYKSKTLFSCSKCNINTSKSTMTLLTVLCQKVIPSYEHVISLLTKQYNALHGRGDDFVPVYLDLEGDTLGEEDDKNLKLREYKVDICEEACVSAGPETIQSGILRAFLRSCWLDRLMDPVTTSRCWVQWIISTCTRCWL